MGRRGRVVHFARRRRDIEGLLGLQAGEMRDPELWLNFDSSGERAGRHEELQEEGGENTNFQLVYAFTHLYLGLEKRRGLKNTCRMAVCWHMNNLKDGKVKRSNLGPL